MPQTRHLTVTGRVQGVGYRAWTVETASRLALDGWVRNRHDGSVEIAVRGEEAALDALVERCRRGPTFARVEDVRAETVADDPALGPGFMAARSE